MNDRIYDDLACVERDGLPVCIAEKAGCCHMPEDTDGTWCNYFTDGTDSLCLLAVRRDRKAAALLGEAAACPILDNGGVLLGDALLARVKEATK